MAMNRRVDGRLAALGLHDATYRLQSDRAITIPVSLFSRAVFNISLLSMHQRYEN